MKNKIELNDFEKNIVLSSLKQRADKFLEKNDLDGYDAIMNVYKLIRGQVK